MHAATAGRLAKMLQAWQAEGESPVTAIHSFPASSSEERHRGGARGAVDRAPHDEGHPRAGSWLQLALRNLDNSQKSARKRCKETSEGREREKEREKGGKPSHPN